jgi:hypothetical protein
MQQKYSYSKVFPDAAARLAYVPTADDAGRVALQLSDKTYWSLEEVSPLRWERLANEVGPGGWRPNHTIYDRIVPLVDLTPGVILFDDEVNVSAYGIVAQTFRNSNVSVMIEKPDGNGGWVSTNNYAYSRPQISWPTWEAPPSLAPYDIGTEDPGGYPIEVGYHLSPMRLPKLPGWLATDRMDYSYNQPIQSGQDVGDDWRFNKRYGAWYGQPDEDGNQITRVRMVGMVKERDWNGDPWTPEQLADWSALGYRVHVRIYGPNYVAWEKTVQIPNNPTPTSLINEDLNLADYGLVSDNDYYRFVAEIKRNGKTIKTLIPSEYVPGEEFDPPSPVVAWRAIPVFPGSLWWNEQNTGGIQAFAGGVQFGDAMGYCSESTLQPLKLVAWQAYPQPAEYLDGTLGDTVVEHPTAQATFIFKSPGTPAGMWGVYGTLRLIPSLDTPRIEAFTEDVGESTPGRRSIIIYYQPGSTTIQDVYGMLNDPDRSFLFVPGVAQNPSYVLQTTDEWNSGDVGPAAVAPVPVPEGSYAGCTLTIRLLVCPPNKRFQFPFSKTGSESGMERLVLRGTRGAIFPSGLVDRGDGPVTGLFYGGKKVLQERDVPSFFSDEITGTGEVQIIPTNFRYYGKRLDWGPDKIRVIPLKWPGGSPCDYTVAMTANDIRVTMTPGVTYMVIAWFPPASEIIMLRKYAYDLAFQTQAQRLAYVPQAGDINKVARQFSDNSYWKLTQSSPAQWVPLPTMTPPGGWQPMLPIFDMAVPIPATPDAVLFDEMVQTGPWGLMASTYKNFNLMWFIEKPDGNGGWAVTSSPWLDKGNSYFAPGGTLVPATFPAFVPAPDPEGYEVAFDYLQDTPQMVGGDTPILNNTATRGQDLGRDSSQSIGEEAHLTRFRVRAVRTGRVYTPEEQATIDALGYRFRMVLYGHNYVAWEKEVPVVATPWTLLMEERIKLSDFGLTSADHGRFRFIGEMRRNGRTIRPYLTREYRAGEVLDPPTYPVRVFTCASFAGSKWYNWSNNAPWGSEFYGRDNGDVTGLRGNVDPQSGIDRGVVLGNKLGQCGEACIDDMTIAAWRDDGALVPVYTDGTLRTRAALVFNLAWKFGNVAIALRSTVVGADGVVPVQVSVIASPGVVSVTAIPGGGVNIQIPYDWDLTYNTPNLPTVAQLAALINAVSADSKVEVIGFQRPDELVAPSDLNLTTALGGMELIPWDGFDAAAGCTFRIRLLVAPLNRAYLYPFTELGELGGTRVIAFRGQAHPGQYTPADFSVGQRSLWMGDGGLRLGTDPVISIPTYQTPNIPAAAVGWHNRIISVKDPGVDEVYYICRQKSDNSYEWVAIPVPV